MHAHALVRQDDRLAGQLRDDVARRSKVGLSFGRTSFLEYVAALKRLFVTDDLGAWNPNLRAKEDIRTSPTRHFVDPSIATAVPAPGI